MKKKEKRRYLIRLGRNRWMRKKTRKKLERKEDQKERGGFGGI